MADFLSRLAGRTLGLVPVAQPFIASMFATGLDMAASVPEAGSFGTPDETAISPVQDTRLVGNSMAAQAIPAQDVGIPPVDVHPPAPVADSESPSFTVHDVVEDSTGTINAEASLGSQPQSSSPFVQAANQPGSTTADHPLLAPNTQTQPQPSSPPVQTPNQPGSTSTDHPLLVPNTQTQPASIHPQPAYSDITDTGQPTSNPRRNQPQPSFPSVLAPNQPGSTATDHPLLVPNVQTQPASIHPQQTFSDFTDTEQSISNPISNQPPPSSPIVQTPSQPGSTVTNHPLLVPNVQTQPASTRTQQAHPDFISVHQQTPGSSDSRPQSPSATVLAPNQPGSTVTDHPLLVPNVQTQPSSTHTLPSRPDLTFTRQSTSSPISNQPQPPSPSVQAPNQPGSTATDHPLLVPNVQTRPANIHTQPADSDLTVTRQPTSSPISNQPQPPPPSVQAPSQLASIVTNHPLLVPNVQAQQQPAGTRTQQAHPDLISANRQTPGSSESRAQSPSAIVQAPNQVGSTSAAHTPQRNGQAPTSQHPAAQTSTNETTSTTPTIRVTIGRIEVRAITPPASTPRSNPGRSGPPLSLDDYLKQSKGGER